MVPPSENELMSTPSAPLLLGGVPCALPWPAAAVITTGVGDCLGLIPVVLLLMLMELLLLLEEDDEDLRAGPPADDGMNSGTPPTES